MSSSATLDEAARIIEEFAPPRLAEPWDNVGWQIRLAQRDLRGVLVALDATPEVLGEAAALGCNLVVTHHPLFFKPQQTLQAGTLEGDTAIAAIRQGTSIFAAHTNLDSTRRGTSSALAEALGLPDGTPLVPAQEDGCGLGLVVHCQAQRTLREWSRRVREAIESPVLMVSGQHQERHERLAMMGGSGGSAVQAALEARASLYIAADIGYHQAQIARAGGLSLLVIDHHASERPVLRRVQQILQRELSCPVSISTTRTTPWETERP